jgi:NitT/TauT family transport system substrate-binding protein
MKRFSALLLALMILVVFLAGCGSTTAPSVSEAPTTSASGEPATSEKPAKTLRNKDIVRVISSGAIEALSNANFFAGIRMGYYAEEGIDIVFETTQSLSLVKMISAGQGEFGYPGPHLTSSGVDNDLDVISIYQLYPNNIFGFAVIDDGTINSIDELRGKTIATYSPTTENQINPILAQLGIKPEEVEYVPVAEARAQMLTEGAVDASWTWAGEWDQWVAQGLNIKFLPSREIYHSCSNTIICNPLLLEEDPDLVERFLRATTKASLFTLLNPRAAAEIALADYPILAKTFDIDTAAQVVESSVKQLLGDVEHLKSGKAGMHDESKWDLMMNDYVKHDIVSKYIPLEKCFTNKFIDAANDFDHAKVEEDAKNFKSAN